MTTICDLNDDNCGTGSEYLPTVRAPIDPGSVGGGGNGLTIEQIITALSGVIEFGHLAQSLRTRIDIINNLEAGFNQLSTQVVTDNSVMAQQLIGLRADLTDAVAYVNNQTTIELNERQALVTSINQMVASLGNGISAALQEESIVRAEQTGALFAEKTVKTDLAGNVAGYGLSSYADPSGAVSDFRVAADKFSIAPPAYVSATPPPSKQMHDGKVWVDTSQGSEVAVTKWWSSATASWSLTPVTAAQPFIYLTTPTTLPDGTVVDPGLYVNSANITKLRADQIDTRGLTIKNAAGQVIFSAGTGLDWNKINGSSKPEDGATRNVFRGNWGNAITYTYGDIVLDGGNGWRAISTHTSSGTNKPPASGTGNTWWNTYTIKGDAGPAVVVLTDRSPAFTSTDGNLDTGQSNIVFTASVFGIDSPTYQWSVTGAQTAPTVLTGSTLTLTAAQFGAATSVIVKCTVNGLYSDQEPVHRINKSTAAAGATVGAKIGHNVTLSDGSVLNSTDFVHRLSKINDTNIGTFMSAGAIGNAYIGNAAISSAKIGVGEVDTLRIQGSAVIVASSAVVVDLTSTQLTVPFSINGLADGELAPVHVHVGVVASETLMSAYVNSTMIANDRIYTGHKAYIGAAAMLGNGVHSAKVVLEDAVVNERRLSLLVQVCKR